MLVYVLHAYPVFLLFQLFDGMSMCSFEKNWLDGGRDMTMRYFGNFVGFQGISNEFGRYFLNF